MHGRKGFRPIRPLGGPPSRLGEIFALFRQAAFPLSVRHTLATIVRGLLSESHESSCILCILEQILAVRKDKPAAANLRSHLLCDQVET